jgi:hypothetical protein
LPLSFDGLSKGLTGIILRLVEGAQTMADTWFRFYNNAVNDPKVQRLNPKLFKFWINILCIASQNAGHIPRVEDVAFSVRLPQDQVDILLDSLVRNNLIHKTDHGFIPHNWDKRQFKSDGSTERVKRFRNRKETFHETGPDQTITDTDYKKVDLSKFMVGKKERGEVTIFDPKERLNRFQKTIAEAIGRDGYMIVGQASDPANPLYTRSLAICKAKAAELKKGWPHQWPS